MKTYVLQVKTHKETQVLKQLKDLNLCGFAPSAIRLLRHRGQWQETTRPLIPGYVFIKTELDTAQYYRVKRAAYVIQFIGNGAPVPLSEEETAFIDLIANEEKPIPPFRMERNNVIDWMYLFGNKVIPIETNLRQRRIRLALPLFGITHIITLSISLP